MKHFFFLLTALAMMTSACTQELRTETLFLEEDIPYHEGTDFLLDLNLNVDFPTDGASQEAIASMRNVIRTRCFGEEYASFTAPVEKLKEAFRDKAVQEYRTQCEGLLHELDITVGEALNLNWTIDIRGGFGTPYKDWITYDIEQYFYEGGAHGIHYQWPVVFDRKTGQVLEYGHFTKGVSEERLRELIDLHKYDDFDGQLNGMGDDNIFNVERIEPSRDFSVGEKGLTFYYQPYDVAPYAFGNITITIPWEELR